MIKSLDKMIKTFENFNMPDYDIGDYILLTEDHDWCSNVAKILAFKEETITFFIETFFLSSGKKYHTWINYSEIGKKITFDEYNSIKRKNFIDFKIKKESEKYNL